MALNPIRYKHKPKSALRIMEGDTVRPNEYPFAVIIGPANLKPSQKIHRSCTGAIIAEAWVITAAHCLDPGSHSKLKLNIYYGNITVHPFNTTEYVKSIKTIPHPHYNKALYTNDIGLVMIEKTPIKIFAILSAVDYLTLLGFPVTYVGGGLTVDDDLLDTKPRETFMGMVKDQLRPLQKGDAVVVQCLRQDPPLLICLRAKCSRKTQIINPGDSGGPLLYRGKIIGVSCCKGVEEAEKHMFYYTSISPFIDWIQDTIREESRPVNQLEDSECEDDVMPEVKGRPKLRYTVLKSKRQKKKNTRSSYLNKNKYGGSTRQRENNRYIRIKNGL